MSQADQGEFKVEDVDAPENAKTPTPKIPNQDYSLYQLANTFFSNDPVIHFIPCGNPTETKNISPSIVIVESDTVVTEFKGKEVFSYLKNPKNVSNKFYYYVREKQEPKKFVPIFNYDFCSSDMKDRLTSFLKELNSKLEKASFKSGIFCLKRKVLLSFELVSILFIFAAVGLFLSTPFVEGEAFYVMISLGPPLIIFALFCLVFSRCMEMKKPNYELSSKSLEKLKEYINEKNIHSFISNNVFLSYPHNLNYIQINVDKNSKIEIENHSKNINK